MVQKRPFEDEESYEFSSKLPLPKQLKQHGSHDLFSEINSCEDVPRVVDTAGDNGLWRRKCEVEEKLDADNGAVPIIRYEDTDYSDEDVQMDDEPFVPFFPEYFFPECTVRTVPRHEDVYSLLLQHPPQKPVPLGPDHQVEVPEWSPHSVVGNDDDEVSGTTIIPMQDFESSNPDGEKVGSGRSSCCCDDKGSIRCARRHTVESRDRLKRTLGDDAFAELGFLEMGEAVAEQWSEDEEQHFHQVVFSNPTSTGKNFWNSLSSAFPSRTRIEILSYYFNVFMLRRRAEQNRFDPSNVDSDNDEWRASDEEDDDDSVVESPLLHVNINKRIVGGDGHGYDYDDEDEDEDDGVDETCHDNDDSTPADDGKKRTTTTDYQDAAQDDSCTSFDNGTSVEEHHLKDNRWPLWDVGYNIGGCRKREAEFLPTCSMIEEVFGNESWNCKADGKGP